VSNAEITGRRWRAIRRAVFAEYGTTCHVCGHERALEVDHLIRRADGGSVHDLRNLRPAHGSNYPCPVCIAPTTGRPRCCNQERNARPAAKARVPFSVDPRTL
jgi:hypothetical protein